MPHLLHALPDTSRPAGPAPLVRPARVVALLLAGSLAAACTGGQAAERPVAAASPTASPTPSPTPSPTSATPSPVPTVRAATPPPGPRVNPLTGLPGTPQLTVAVKVDNTRLAMPQAGLNEADVVYVEEVEGGITRLLALYSSRRPALVGPVRSVRENDMELLAGYGPIAFGSSGGNTGVMRQLRSSPIKDASEEVLKGHYSRRPGRKSPYNLFLTAGVQGILAATGSAAPRDAGLRWAPADSRTSAAPAAAGASVVFGRRTRVGWRYDGSRYVIRQDGRDQPALEGGALRTPNIVVQYVEQRASQYVDVLGQRSPFSITVGRGPAVVFRDGRRIDARWYRPTADRPTRIIDAAGRDVPLRPGGAWVVLAPARTPLGGA